MQHQPSAKVQTHFERRGYLSALETRPILVKALTAGVLVAAGDAISQVAVERKEKYDVPRTTRMFLFGLCLSGPSMHYWYRFLGNRISGTGLKRGVKTMLADQIVFAPFMISGFFAFTSALEGKNVDQIKAKLKRDWLPALKANYILWPAAQLVNFTFVPQNLAVLYVSGIAIVWNTWLCYMNAKTD